MDHFTRLVLAAVCIIAGLGIAVWVMVMVYAQRQAEKMTNTLVSAALSGYAAARASRSGK